MTPRAQEFAWFSSSSLANRNSAVMDNRKDPKI